MNGPITRHGFRAALCTILLVAAVAAHAEQTYLVGRIANVTFAGDAALIRLDTGTPGNCSGTPYGWMMIPASYKTMTAFILGLWLRGDVAAVQMTVYTDGVGGSGYCTINQIDPVE